MPRGGEPGLNRTIVIEHAREKSPAVGGVLFACHLDVYGESGPCRAVPADAVAVAVVVAGDRFATDGVRVVRPQAGVVEQAGVVVVRTRLPDLPRVGVRRERTTVPR